MKSKERTLYQRQKITGSPRVPVHDPYEGSREVGCAIYETARRSSMRSLGERCGIDFTARAGYRQSTQPLPLAAANNL